MSQELPEEKIKFWDKRLTQLVHHLEAMRVADYVELLQKPHRLIALNFLAGLSRGLGIALGATLLVALVLNFLQRLLILNIPGIGNFVAEIIRIVEQKNGSL
ncbi:MAG TPA: hypothetical protein DEA44_15175 [Firmicutes bacterium]|nr:hypothetical protein [Bacillota bacterium]HWR55706.1 DUF5665 domain-containing protein [Negativicutes bacterium]